MSFKIRFFQSLLMFSALVFLAGYLLFSTILKEFFAPVFYALIFYFMLLTLAGRLVLVKGDFEVPGNFNMRYFIVRWIKVFIHMIFIMVYLFIDRDNAPAFVLTFLAIYIIYSVFDVYTLSYYLKKK
jgi:hypothetical protein